MENNFSIDSDTRDGVVLLRLRGALDQVTASTLRGGIGKALAGCHAPAVVFDVAELTFCDSTGLSVLLNARMATEEAGGRVALCSVTGRLAWMLQATGLKAHFNVFPTTQEAVVFLK
ncbi:STAS domain-containing protein [Nonomuraea sp. NPDC050310]|uniref:STAS domain-containing protein n=1 Tax=Nonomuraea sp. NPDC050310 TaxID=3154935 RepID=UPI0033F77A60